MAVADVSPNDLLSAVSDTVGSPLSREFAFAPTNTIIILYFNSGLCCLLKTPSNGCILLEY